MGNSGLISAKADLSMVDINQTGRTLYTPGTQGLEKETHTKNERECKGKRDIERVRKRHSYIGRQTEKDTETAVWFSQRDTKNPREN